MKKDEKDLLPAIEARQKKTTDVRLVWHDADVEWLIKELKIQRKQVEYLMDREVELLGKLGGAGDDASSR